MQPPDDARPAKLTGAFERFRKAVPEAVVAQMLQGRSAFSRGGPLSAWVVVWLMIFQRLDAKGTLAAAVRELLLGTVWSFVREADGEAAESLSANTSADSQALQQIGRLRVRSRNGVMQGGGRREGHQAGPRQRMGGHPD